MPLTQEQKNEFDMNCYGMLRGRLAEAVDTAIGDPTMVAMSMLSDAQECIERGMGENARKLINQAKWVIGERLDNREPSLKRGALNDLI